jgi:hypothetical protein
MIWKKAFAVASLSFLFLSPVEADAAEFTAKISKILYYEDADLIYIYVEGGTQNRPACAGSNGDYLSFKMSRPRAREYLSGLMAAFLAGKPVTFGTAGACIDQSVSDTIRYFQINSQ